MEEIRDRTGRNTRSQQPSRGICSPPFLMSSSTDGGRICDGVNIKEHHPEGMNASNRAEGGTSAFSWQFANGTHGTPDRLKRVVPLVTPAISTRSSLPFLLAALPAAFFIARGQPNAAERSSPRVLTVLLLLTGELQDDDGDGASNEGT